MKTVFAIVCSATPALQQTKFFATKELAAKRLKKMADERRYNMGVHGFKEEFSIDGEIRKFSYLLEWEEWSVSFSIIEASIEEEAVPESFSKK
jgi:hypothetical protein